MHTEILSFLTCQTLPFKFGRISLRKKINEKTLSKIPTQTRAPTKKRVTIIFYNETKLIE